MDTFQQGLRFSAPLVIPISVFLIFLKFIKVKAWQKPSKNNEREHLLEDMSESQKMEEFDSAKTVRVNEKINNITASPNEVLDIK